MKQKDFALIQLFAEGTSEGEGETGAAPAAGETGETTDPAAEDLYAEFDSLIGEGGRFADAFKKKSQANFNKRYGEFKKTEAREKRQSQFIEQIASRYPDVDASDLDALEEAFLKDPKYYESEAYSRGVDAAELAEQNYTKLKLARYEDEKRAQTEKAQAEAAAKEFYEKLVAEEAEMKKTYPAFSLDSEIRDPKFREMLKKGISLEDAYWGLHHGDLAKQLTDAAKQGAVAVIAKKGARAPEGAAGAVSATVANVDYSKMSREEFMKIYNK